MKILLENYIVEDHLIFNASCLCCGDVLQPKKIDSFSELCDFCKED